MNIINQKTVKKIMEIAIPVVTGVATIAGEFAKQKKEKQFNEMVREVAELKKKIGES